MYVSTVDQKLFKQIIESHRDEYQAFVEAHQAATPGPSGVSYTPGDSVHAESAAPPTEESLSEGRLTISCQRLDDLGIFLNS